MWRCHFSFLQFKYLRAHFAGEIQQSEMNHSFTGRIRESDLRHYRTVVTFSKSFPGHSAPQSAQAFQSVGALRGFRTVVRTIKSAMGNGILTNLLELLITHRL